MKLTPLQGQEPSVKLEVMIIFFLIPTIYFFFYLLPNPKWSSQQPLSWELLIIFSGREAVDRGVRVGWWPGDLSLGGPEYRFRSAWLQPLCSFKFCVLTEMLLLLYFPTPTPLLPAIIKELWVHCPAITPGASQGTSLSLPFYICNISNSFPT